MESGSTTRETIYDVVVVGAGAAGLTAAITARKAGLDVLVVEKDDVVGGTSALSGGWLWIPGNDLARAEGIEDNREMARAYLRSESGNHYNVEKVEAFLDNAPAAIRFLEGTGRFQFFLGGIPDYHHPAPGALKKGRSICAEPYSTHEMGKLADNLRAPLKALKFMGIPIASGPELWHFLRAGRSLPSTLFVSKVIGRDLWDKLRYRRSTRLVNGNSLVARLVMAASDCGIPIWRSCRMTGLDRVSGGICGVTVTRNGRTETVRVRKGVVLAAGGFPWDIERRRSVYLHSPGENEHLTMAPVTNTGDGQKAAEMQGARMITDYPIPAAWFPVSLVPSQKGKAARFIHFLDRGKPGVIAVSQSGERFVDEGAPYGDFVEAMIRTATPGHEKYVFLIADSAAVRRYGLGIAKPWPVPIGKHLRSGYLMRAPTLAALAAKTGLPASTLERTVASFNAGASKGVDESFHRGEMSMSRYNGDAGREDHPSLAPLLKPPFYAVKVYPGDIGTFAGLATDEKARVLDQQGQPIDGLYAVGNDMASVFGGAYPGAGATLGPAVTFGYIAGTQLASG